MVYGELKLPMGKVLSWVTLFNAALVTGGTVFSSITFQSVHQQYQQAQQHVRESQDRYQDALALMQDVNREAEVIQARISRTIEVMTDEVKHQRDRHMLIIAGEADDVVAAAEDTRILITNLQVQLDQLAALSSQEITASSQQYQAEVFTEQENLQGLSDGIKQSADESLATIKLTQSSVKQAGIKTTEYLNGVKENYLQLTKFNEKALSDSIAIVESERNRSLDEVKLLMQQLEEEIFSSSERVSAIMLEFEDARLALEASRTMAEQAPAGGLPKKPVETSFEKIEREQNDGQKKPELP